MNQPTVMAMLERAARGEAAELGALLEDYRPRLERMLELRMDPRLRGRVEPCDVLQEAIIEVMERLPEYVAKPDLGFFVWVRFLTGQKLLQVHRKHLDTARRDIRREVPLMRPSVPGASSFAIASAILDRSGTPSRAAMKAELRASLQAGLDDMQPADREVLVLRHFEQLANGEIAQIMEISESAASQRYFRALGRLREILNELELHSDLFPG